MAGLINTEITWNIAIAPAIVSLSCVYACFVLLFASIFESRYLSDI